MFGIPVAADSEYLVTSEESTSSNFLGMRDQIHIDSKMLKEKRCCVLFNFMLLLIQFCFFTDLLNPLLPTQITNASSVEL